MSPTQRSIGFLKEQGYFVWRTETWNAFAKIRQDLFGFVDLVALGDGQTIGIQTTTGDHAAERVKKIQGHDNLAAVKGAGWSIHVHGWRKLKDGWQVRVIEI